MRVCIHRGCDQIGGSCVEVEFKGKRLILDLGLPLDAEEVSEELVPKIDDLENIDNSILGILITHPHLDHYGLARYANQKIKVGIGKIARKIIKAYADFAHREIPLPPPGWDFEHEQPIQIGPFTVTPYLVDHSAYDSFSLLIEAGNKKLFYSGDFRAHGRKAALFEKFLNSVPDNIDTLLLEGSSFGRIETNKRFETEKEIEKRMFEVFKNCKGMAFVQCSSQNIDRIVSVFRASKRANRKLVIDLYTAAILKATGNKSIPQSDWKDIALYIPERQKWIIVDRSLFDIKDSHSSNRIYRDSLLRNKSKYVLIFRGLHIPDLELEPELIKDSEYIYSLWEGYWEDDKHKTIKDFIDKYKINRTVIHSSGHACLDDLKRLVDAMKPQAVVPIHSFHPEKYHELFSNTKLHQDGEWWEL